MRSEILGDHAARRSVRLARGGGGGRTRAPEAQVRRRRGGDGAVGVELVLQWTLLATLPVLLLNPGRVYVPVCDEIRVISFVNFHTTWTDVPAGLVDKERFLARGHDRLTCRADAQRLVVPLVVRLARLVEHLDDSEARVACESKRDLLAGGEGFGTLEAAN